MKNTIKTLALFTTGLVVGVVVGRVNNKRYKVESLDEILIIEMTKRRPKGIVLDLNGDIKDKFYMTEVE
ncbi:hypothetical protein ACN2AU_04645 [Aerococcus viridans]